MRIQLAKHTAQPPVGIVFDVQWPGVLAFEHFPEAIVNS